MASLDDLRARAARLVMVRMGSALPPKRTATDDLTSIQALCQRYPIGGVLLFNARGSQIADTLHAVHDAAPKPLLVASDIERGVGQQVDGATSFPRALACGRAGTRSVQILARITALEAEACGIHWAFAPVADLRNEPRNPIIATRAFGETPRTVAPHVHTYVETAQAHGLATTAKHAPGHGRTTTDSHADQPVVEADAEALTDDAWPFRAAIQAGTTSLMTAHVSYPALDPSGAPATASTAILQGLLRDRWGFEGVIVSDSLLMDGIDAPGARAATLLNAGVDMLLDPPDARAVIEGIAEAVATGDVSEERLNAAVARVHRLMAWVHEHRDAGLRPNAALQDMVGRPLHQQAATSIAREATFGRGPATTELSRQKDTVVVRCTAHPAESDDDSTLRQALSDAWPQAAYVACPAEASLSQTAAVAARIHQAEQVVAVLTLEPAAWHDFQFPQAHRAVFDALRAHPRAFVIAAGSPHVLHAFPDAWSVGATYSDGVAAQRALVQRLTQWTGHVEAEAADPPVHP